MSNVAYLGLPAAIHVVHETSGQSVLAWAFVCFTDASWVFFKIYFCIRYLWIIKTR